METTEKNKLTLIQNKTVESVRKGHAEQGCYLLSGANTATGNFYGFSVGSTKPDTLVITTDSTVLLNNVSLAIDDDIINFVSEGEYIPVSFTSITLTGSGYVKLWSK